LAALALALLTTPLAASTAPSYLYSTICRPLSFASHLCIFIEEACALPCYAYAAYRRDLYLELSALAAADEEEKEEEKKE
jgi:hypothetical protein